MIAAALDDVGSNRVRIVRGTARRVIRAALRKAAQKGYELRKVEPPMVVVVPPLAAMDGFNVNPGGITVIDADGRIGAEE